MTPILSRKTKSLFLLRFREIARYDATYSGENINNLAFFAYRFSPFNQFTFFGTLRHLSMFQRKVSTGELGFTLLRGLERN